MAQKHPAATRIRAAKNRRLKTAAQKKEKHVRRSGDGESTGKPAARTKADKK